jgi:hypothetical protein
VNPYTLPGPNPDSCSRFDGPNADRGHRRIPRVRRNPGYLFPRLNARRSLLPVLGFLLKSEKGTKLVILLFPLIYTWSVKS